jgi:predicted AlkP superfamily pyrophosphatase or phosphodiesterase
MAITEQPPVGSDEHREHVEQARRALLDPEWAPIVEMVLSRDGDTYEAAAVDGRVTFRRTSSGTSWDFEVVAVEGRDPLANQATDHLAPLPAELANRFPERTENAYPNAFLQLSQLFDSPAAPDLCAIHTAAHNWQDQGGHIGEHGSIDVVQSRAPFIVAGAGVRNEGLVPRSCRLVDVAPTIAALMGVAPTPSVGENGLARDGYLRRQDGEVVDGVIDEMATRPEHVVGFLFDGANANVLYDLAARGEAPNVARLIEMGTAFGHGAMSSLPTVTLANHTSILTGVQPGHHGILHNAWWDRASQRQIVTNSPATWIEAMATLGDDIETLYEAVLRTWPHAVVASINEPADRGASYSTFGELRSGRDLGRPPAELPHSTERFVRPVKEYRWSSKIDHSTVTQFRDVWAQADPRPRFTWCNFTLTDAAFHEGGPYSEIAAASVHDTDGRLGEILDEIERSGVFDRTAFFLVADHGMEESNPECTGNWADALDATGLRYRDEGYGFIYVDP